MVLLLSVYVLFWPDPAGGAGPPGADKLVHLVLFALLAATARLRGGQRGVLVLLAGYALLSELVQATLLADRSGDVGDLLADLVGIAGGWWLVRGAVPDRPVDPDRPAPVRT